MCMCEQQQDDVWSVEDVDKVMRDGLGMRYAFMGPFETCHLNAEGLTTIIRVCSQIENTNTSSLRSKKIQETKFFRFNLLWCNLSTVEDREYIVINGQRYELIEIKDYKPLQQQSTECTLRKHWPISAVDEDSTFPSSSSVVNDKISNTRFDMKYARLMCLSTDIPKNG